MHDLYGTERRSVTGGQRNDDKNAGRRAPADARRSGHDVSGRPEDRDPVGEGGEAHLDPDTGWAPPLPRGGGPRTTQGSPKYGKRDLRPRQAGAAWCASPPLLRLGALGRAPFEVVRP